MLIIKNIMSNTFRRYICVVIFDTYVKEDSSAVSKIHINIKYMNSA